MPPKRVKDYRKYKPSTSYKLKKMTLKPIFENYVTLGRFRISPPKKKKT